MRAILILGIVALLAGGCGHALGYAGSHPGAIVCKGKGTISGSGAGSAGAGISGSELNHFSIQADCGDGFSFSQGPSVAK